MNIGLIGFGGVGKSFIELLNLKEDSLKHINLKYIIKSNGGIYNPNGLNIKEIVSFINENKPLEDYYLWSNITIEYILTNRDIDTIVELTSTNIVDGEPGYFHIKEALRNNLNVVTGNKGPILLHYKELKELSDKNNVQLKIGCTTGGALPSINVGTIDTLGSEVVHIEGVLNGTTNFILEEMLRKNISYKEALLEAQRLKIAEANPTLDVKGYDTAVKMLILANVIMNKELSLKDINLEGIINIKLEELKEAQIQDKKIKLIGCIKKENNNIVAKVGPRVINKEHPLYSVDGKNKGVYYKTDTLGDMTIIGGASSPLNAAASILRDLLAIK